MTKLLPLFGAFFLLVVPARALAHCDTMDGPVVKAGQAALRTAKLAPALAWVQPKDEAEIKAAFDKALAVRKLGAQAKELADYYFLETLVRVHRASEGAGFEGLKPAGSNKDVALTLADTAVESGKLEPLAKALANAVQAGLAERFKHLREMSPPAQDVTKGREWVRAYVDFIHYAAAIHHAATNSESHKEISEAEPHRRPVD